MCSWGQVARYNLCHLVCCCHESRPEFPAIFCSHAQVISGVMLAASCILMVRYLMHITSLDAMAPRTSRAKDWQTAVVALGAALSMGAMAFASIRNANRFHLARVGWACVTATICVCHAGAD